MCIYMSMYSPILYIYCICMKKCKHPHTQKICSQEEVLSVIRSRFPPCEHQRHRDGVRRAHQRTAPRSGLRLASVAAELQVSSISCEGRAAMNKKLSTHTIYLVKNGVLRGFPYHATYSDYLESPTYFMIENSEVENFKVGAELSPKKASSKESTHKRSKKINREGNLIIF